MKTKNKLYFLTIGMAVFVFCIILVLLGNYKSNENIDDSIIKVTNTVETIYANKKAYLEISEQEKKGLRATSKAQEEALVKRDDKILELEEKYKKLENDYQTAIEQVKIYRDSLNAFAHVRYGTNSN